MGLAQTQLPAKSNVSMRHIYLYTHLLIAEANKAGRRVRIIWGNIKTASIGPDHQESGGLLLTLPLTAAMGTEEDLELINGLLDHEILCHGLHTDFSVVMKPDISGTLLNVLEDPRGELLAKPRFRGANTNIHNALKILKKRGIFHGPVAGQETPQSILVAWLVTELRSELLEQTCLQEFSLAYRALAVATFGAALVDQVKAIAVKGCNAPDTQGANKAANEIVDLLKLTKDQQTAAPEQGPGSPSDTQGEPGSPGQTEGKGQPGDISDALNQVLSASQSDCGSYAKGLEDIICSSLPGVNQNRAGGYQPDLSNEMQEMSLSKSGGSFENRRLLRAGAQKTAAMLSATFEQFIEAITQNEVLTTNEGRLNTRKLWRYAVGDDQIFTKRKQAEEIDTCFYLLGDESSSMRSRLGPEPEKGKDDNRITAQEACNRVSVAVGEVLNNTSIPVGIATYNTVIREWHAFEDSWASTLQRYMPTPKGQTKTHLAVVWALKKLIDRPEARRILIVITDGDPGNSDMLRSAVDEAALMGIEVRFVLIGDEHYNLFQDAGMACGVAKTDNDLATAVFAALKQGFV
ncbi:VWA domain-containing protein [Pseudomonas asiatica]|uniref:von Willebrand factor, type A n=1 Tax=Pseudomonas taiwanensis SJ9 TaxID=1388762 RepID=V7D7I8_9PSED|nr:MULTISPECIES: VWA domain-containing protein [Pseudomonas]ESW38307.1 von Willebrand factor, type A [Pseudomonas taiwanensis SJ9]MCE0852859.1 VWA domain-containing protein [Pseudomonas asiatica]URD45268.1 VWA domain-containing protein [Pseudomonas sp. BYT-5]URL00863.1 VWA domain-containing protein [Pseudomonas sp. BYT-1]